MRDLKDLLKKLYELKGSDLHLKAGQPPIFRINGKLTRSQEEPLTPQEIFEMFKSVLTEEKFSTFLKEKEYDFAIEEPSSGRFRANLFFQKNMPGGVFRYIPKKIPTIEELNLPEVLKGLVKRKQGLILVVGPTGSGKSTTLAALINEINENLPYNIITVEDPIEFIHTDKVSIINQREIGLDTNSWENALKRALRQDPDCILIGEMRDRASISIAISAAETGHLVLSTLHTNDAKQTIERIVDSFPHEAKEFVRHQLSLVLIAIISQRLCEKKDGSGRIAAIEVMINTPAIAKAISENQPDKIQSLIEDSASFYKMQSLNQHLFKLVMDEHITEEEAIRVSNNPSDLKIKIRTAKAPKIETQQPQKKERKF